ncbi:hypothetical protein [Fervidobacterium islandicum]|uniref:hypothetical protein n=1 Tax=Fervidobacterium islandicum TaxID=2423 RepID=UPI003A6492C0
MSEPKYYLISVSNKENLNLCVKYQLAGFPSSTNGLWSYLDIDEGDYISFLYGARIKNLYKVEKKIAYKNAEKLPPWKPITFKESGKTYSFPYRMKLRLVREFDESIVRSEFAYVAEDLLLRGGYRKTHFQADAAMLSYVSSLGRSVEISTEQKIETPISDLDVEEFVPKITFRKTQPQIGKEDYTVVKFNENILQSLLKRTLSSLLNEILIRCGSNKQPHEFEILSEKALSKGFVDLFVKLKHPVERNQYILVEAKNRVASNKDLNQLNEYIDDFDKEGELLCGILIAEDFPKNLKTNTAKILKIKYSFDGLNQNKDYEYDQLVSMMKLEII